MPNSSSASEAAAEVFSRVFASVRPRTALPEVQIQFCPFANANSSIRLEGARLIVRITDVLEGAPTAILEALANILLSKLFRRAIPGEHADQYRRYMNRQEMRRTLHLIRQARGRKLASPAKGSCYDLQEIFEKLNLTHFFGLMARPELGWSLRVSRRTLGHYDPSHNTIILSKVLDRPTVPRLAVEFVMFHEMLHLRYPVDHSGRRRCVHTPEFKAAEREFPEYKRAKELLKQL